MLLWEGGWAGVIVRHSFQQAGMLAGKVGWHRQAAWGQVRVGRGRGMKCQVGWAGSVCKGVCSIENGMCTGQAGKGWDSRLAAWSREGRLGHTGMALGEGMPVQAKVACCMLQRTYTATRHLTETNQSVPGPKTNVKGLETMVHPSPYWSPPPHTQCMKKKQAHEM